MHPYATDSNERKLVPLLLVIVSVLSAWFLNRVLGVLQFNLPWWIDAPSVVGFYGVFYNIFDKYLWRVPILQRIGLVKVPDLNGTWKGDIVSSFDAQATKHDVTVEIRQSWARISINVGTQNSKSHSLTAAILTENQNTIMISYEYLNEPRPNAKTTMHTHRGTTRLTLASDSQTLEGDYYSGRDRQNFGVLSIRRL
jgi:hypothetical protein